MTGNAVPVIGTFWARLTVNGDDDYLHEGPEKVFSVGVVTGCPRPLVVRPDFGLPQYVSDLKSNGLA